MQLRILSATDVTQALPMAAAIEGMKRAFGQLAADRATVPLRARIDVPAVNGVSLFMPAHLTESDDLAVKIVSVFPENVRRQEPTIHAAVMVLDASNGRPLALLEGGTLTAIRTGASAGAATDLLARRDAGSVAIIGSGVQARTQLEAVCTVREIRRAWVYSPNREHAETFAQEMAGRGPIPTAIKVAGNPDTAVSQADIICTATTAREPVFDGRSLQPGSHINAVGSFTPEMQEVDALTVQRALIVVDSLEAALAEAGDLIVPLRSGELSREAIQVELGELVNGEKPGRTAPEQITYFKSVGIAVQDAAAGRIALANAVAQGLGQVVSL